MGLRDKASKVLDALMERDGRRAASALGEVFDSARVRLMDGVVSRISGHPVHTDGGAPRQADLSAGSSEVAPIAPEPRAPEPVEAASPPSPPSPAPEPEPEFRPEPTSAPEPTPEPEPLPQGYQEDRLVLVARDPTWAFAHWDFSPARLAEASAGLTDPRALLRFYEVGSDAPLIDADVDPSNGRYYLRVPRPGRRYEARLVLVGADGDQREVARSNDAEPPAVSPRAPDASPRFVQMDAQTDVLDRADQVLVPPPRLVMNPARSEVGAPGFALSHPGWSAVMAKVRGRRLAEQVAMGDLGTSPSRATSPTGQAGSRPEAMSPEVAGLERGSPSLSEAFEATSSPSAWVIPEPRWPSSTD